MAQVQLDDGSGDGSTLTGPMALDGVTAPAAVTVGAAVDATGAALTSYGYTETQANDLVARVNQLRTAVLQIQAALQSYGPLA